MKQPNESTHTLTIHSRPVFISIIDYGPAARITADSDSGAECLFRGEFLRQFVQHFAEVIQKPSMLCLPDRNYLVWRDAGGVALSESPFSHMDDGYRQNEKQTATDAESSAGNGDTNTPL